MLKQKTLTFLLILPVLLFGRHERNLDLILENPLDLQREDELIIVSRDSLTKMLGDLDKEQMIIVNDLGIFIPSQCDDPDKDGSWDELAFVYTFKPRQSVTLTLKVIDQSNIPEYQKRTNIRFARIIKEKELYEEADSAYRLHGFMSDPSQFYPQFEGPGWENDKVGFRNYFDERNGMDLFGKITTLMVLDKVGTGEDYHTLHSWGMDLLKVGSSLGAGSVGVSYKDSLYHLSAIEGASFHLIVEGPVRSVFDLDFKEIIAGSLHLSLKHRITIVAGEYGYRSHVYINNASDSFNFITGIVNLHSDTLYSGSTDKTVYFFTHDKQSENNDLLGMGIILKKENFNEQIQALDSGATVVHSYVVKMNYKKEVEFQFYAGWEKTNPAFAAKDQFEQYLYEAALRYENPIQIEIKLSGL